MFTSIWLRMAAHDLELTFMANDSFYATDTGLVMKTSCNPRHQGGL